MLTWGQLEADYTKTQLYGFQEHFLNEGTNQNLIVPLDNRNTDFCGNVYRIHTF